MKQKFKRIKIEIEKIKEQSYILPNIKKKKNKEMTIGDNLTTIRIS